MPTSTSTADDIVVELAQLDDVLRAIERLQPKLREEGVLLSGEPLGELKQSPRLGLALVEVRFQNGTRGTGARLLEVLRDEFSRKLGWTPTMGINETLTHVGSLQHGHDEEGVEPTSFIQGGAFLPASFIQGGGTGFPEPFEEPLPAPRATAAGQRARVGLIDTRLAANPALFGSCLASRSAILSSSASAHPYLSGHATFVAGLVQRRAPGASIELHHILRASDARASAWDVAVMMAGLAGSGLDILNLSLGCFTANDDPPLLLKHAVELLTPQIVVVAAAGNYRAVRYANGKVPKARPFWPAAFDEVVAVGADETPGKVAPFSANYPWVDAYAPGVGVVSTYLDGKVAFPASPPHPPDDWPAELMDFHGVAKWSGTSFSAATVSGAIAARTLPGRRSARDALRLVLGRDSDVRSGGG